MAAKKRGAKRTTRKTTGGKRTARVVPVEAAVEDEVSKTKDVFASGETGLVAGPAIQVGEDPVADLTGLAEHSTTNGHSKGITSGFVDEPGISSFIRRLYPGTQVGDVIEDPFRENARVFSAISMIADAAMSVPIVVFDGNPEVDEERNRSPRATRSSSS